MKRFIKITAIATVTAVTAGAGPALAGDPVQSRPTHLDAQVSAGTATPAHAVTERGAGVAQRGKPTRPEPKMARAGATAATVMAQRTPK